ncbi:MAG: V-type ATP synthase subunit D [Candidatus Aureabacteria bacterium]|nr:V-type ATP synthase subunit D [Candidatus Auribacterota bacterium]
MKIIVNPNRMELLKLRKRLDLSQRGHRLLKEKLEGLVKNFMPLVDEYRRKRTQLDELIPRTLNLFALAAATSSREIVTLALEECRGEANVSMEMRKVMGVGAPTFRLDEFRLEMAYSLIATPPELDLATSELGSLLPKIIELASIEELLRRLAREIEKTRRRVNALEYVMIPEIARTKKSIEGKLEEAERGSRVRLMKVKEMLEARGM